MAKRKVCGADELKIFLQPVGDLLIFNKGDGRTRAPPCPDTTMNI